MWLDASVGGTIKTRTREEIRELIESMIQNDYIPQSSREHPQKSKQDKSLEENLLAHNRLLWKQIEVLAKKLENIELESTSSKHDLYEVVTNIDYGGFPLFKENNEQVHYLGGSIEEPHSKKAMEPGDWDENIYWTYAHSKQQFWF